MDDVIERPLPGVTVTIGPRAVRISSEAPLSLLSSAVVEGGVCELREILNVHVSDQYDGARPEDDLAAAAAELGVREAFVGLMTAASTEHARCATGSLGDLTVAAVVSVGLSNTSSAGVTPPVGPGPAHDAAPGPGTINLIVLVDAVLSPAAMVNAVITATEAKTMTLAEWSVTTSDGLPASGTSTDTVVVACTGRGEEVRYAGPATPVGWLTGRTIRAAITRICEEKVERDGGRIGW